jgi:O-antigen/teichoic acid export membrane protein
LCYLAQMSIRKLAGETAVYGMSSILGRLLYFLLVPLYVRVFDPAEYGVVTDLFSFIGLLLIFFTYRMETAYFRFGTDTHVDRNTVFKTAFSSIVLSSLLLAALIFIFRESLASLFRYPEYAYLIGISALILALDAISEIPLSRLRLESKALRFASIRLINIAVNIGFNLFFLVLCPYLESQGALTGLTGLVYDPSIGIGYIFISNALASAVQLLLLLPWMRTGSASIDFTLWRKMLVYSLPLIIVGISFAINELLDRKIMIWLLPGSIEENKVALGAYGACYKLTMILALFTQAFRYGAEPFFFNKKNDANARQIYAEVAHYYGIVVLAGCLFTLLYLDIFKFILEESYWTALGVVPILLLANLMNGMYYNVSIWYRLSDKTMTGAWIALMGASLTIILNILWLPVFGFYGAAWATLICYSLMLLVCYLIGKKQYPIPYKVREFFFYLAFALALYFISEWFDSLNSENLIRSMLINSLLLLIFSLVVIIREKKTLLRVLRSVR